MPTPDESPASEQGPDRDVQAQSDPPSDHDRRTGRDVLEARADARARERYHDQIDHRVRSALDSARIGVVYNPFADAPGGIEASPATFWDYFVGEVSKALPLSTYQAGADGHAGQTDLGAFSSDGPEVRTDGGTPEIRTDGGTDTGDTEQSGQLTRSLTWKFHVGFFALVTFAGYSLADVSDSVRPPYTTWRTYLAVGLGSAIVLTSMVWWFDKTSTATNQTDDGRAA
jgi:hypothetical protein